MKKKTKRVVKKQTKTKDVMELPEFFKDKQETLLGILKMSERSQQLIYEDAVRLTRYCKNPVRLWQFQRMSLAEQRAHLPGLYRGYSARSRDLAFKEAKLYMRYLIKEKPGFWATALKKLTLRKGDTSAGY